jgi:hypothetical protein
MGLSIAPVACTYMAKVQNNPKTPKARNNAAHASLQNYFDRIFHSLDDRREEFKQMKKYFRVYQESMEFLEIKKTIDLAAGSIYEINIANKLDCQAIGQLAQSLNQKNVSIKSYIKGKPVTLQIKLLFEVSKNIQKITTNLQQIIKNMNRIKVAVPIIKTILKMKDKDEVLSEISNALRVSLDEPDLNSIKVTLKQELESLKPDSRFHFELFNDISDKLIGLLNDKLMLIIGVSEFLIEGVEDGGANDVIADRRLPDELRVLFLASTALDILYKIKEIRDCIINTLDNVKAYAQIINGDRLEPKFKELIKGGDQSIHAIISTSVKSLQMMKPAIDEIATKIDNINVTRAIKLSYALIYEKANRIWENPYKN